MELMGLAQFPDRLKHAISEPHTTPQRTGFGWVMAILSTFGFSLAPPIAKAAITVGMDPTTLLTMRLILSTLLLGGALLLANGAPLAMDRRGLWVAGGAGLTNGVGMITFFWALTRIQASVGSMIFSLSPLVVLLMLAWRGERLTRRHILRLVLGLVGVYLLIGPGSLAAGGTDWIGVGLVLVTIITFAVHLTLIQWSLQGYDARVVTFYVVAGMTLVSFAFWLFQGAEWHDPGWQGWLAIVALAVASTWLARLALFAGVRYLGSGQIALLTPLETFLTVLWSVLFLGEWLTTWQWIGGALILLSALLAVRRLGRTRRPPRWRAWPRL